MGVVSRCVAWKSWSSLQQGFTALSGVLDERAVTVRALLVQQECGVSEFLEKRPEVKLVERILLAQAWKRRHLVFCFHTSGGLI